MVEQLRGAVRGGARRARLIRLFLIVSGGPGDRRTGSAPTWHTFGLAMASLLCHTDAMNLHPYVEDVRRHLLLAAEAGGEEARAIAERLVAPLEAALLLNLQHALSAAAEEITLELAPGSVELRLRGRDPEFVVTPPPAEPAADPRPEPAGAPVPLEDDDGALWRINVRMPDRLKPSIERAARREGLSVNAWLVRAAAAALGRSDAERGPEHRPPQAAQHHTGWAR